MNIRRSSILLWGVAAIALIASINLFYYQYIDSAFMYKHIVSAKEFNLAPDKSGYVKYFDAPFSPFTYKPYRRMSKATYDEFYGEITLTESIVENTILVARKTRSFLKHAQKGAVYPFIPDQTITIAKSRPVVCGTYARITLAALDYLGYTARIIYLAGHVTLEVYDPELNQWIYIDPNWAVYFTNEDGKYLSVTELQEYITQHKVYIAHTYDFTSDDPFFQVNGNTNNTDNQAGLMITNKTLVNRFTNGYTAYEDGLGYTYRRKGLIYAFSPVHIVYLENENLPWKTKFGGIANLILLNTILIALSLLAFPRKDKSH